MNCAIRAGAELKCGVTGVTPGSHLDGHTGVTGVHILTI